MSDNKYRDGVVDGEYQGQRDKMAGKPKQPQETDGEHGYKDGYAKGYSEAYDDTPPPEKEETVPKKEHEKVKRQLEECRKSKQQEADDAYAEGRRDAWKDAWKRYGIKQRDSE
ncbi:hypothetical protein CDG81_23005 [Actinopolyspora erythraea]|uniref:Uncharacterized protein n=1 Tax=Actinopolyspora erythraea TaxID=414996 RepID=A0A099DA70_9ACTN|nr:hypothetical protein [Actinopolyspora erythraea]ASU80659.1 hypothetical protein CDG81_23005 [Actinopolyspora erythraea]KGI82974.1 hypothetical protein IL38_01810 [Actinopolyspora erythraea]